MKLKDIIRIIVTPSCWIRNHPTSQYLSKHINSAIDCGSPVVKVGPASVKLGGLELWVQNYPYAYGNPYSYPNGAVPKLPDRATVFRLYDYINDEAEAKVIHLCKNVDK